MIRTILFYIAEESAAYRRPEIVRVYSDEGAHVQDALREDIASGKIDVDATFAVLCGQGHGGGRQHLHGHDGRRAKGRRW